jgi:hypothetical protein
MTNQYSEQAKLRERIAQLRGENRQERAHSEHLKQLLGKALGLVKTFHDDLAERKPPRVYEIDLFVAHASEVLEAENATSRSAS